MRKLQKCVLVMLIMLGMQAMSSAAVWEVSAWTDDASTGIDSSKTYTHLVNNSSSGNVATVNGVVFTNAWNGGFANGSLNGGGYIDWDSGNNINAQAAGTSYELSTHFRYSNSNLNLNGLTPGGVYELTLFSVAWEDGTRTVTLTDKYGSFVFNQDEYGNNNGIKVVGIYTADANGELNLGMVNDFHLYAIANCEYTGDLPVVVTALKPDILLPGRRTGVDTVLEWAEEFSGSLTNPKFNVYMDPNETRVTAMDPSTLVSEKQSEFTFAPDLDPNSVYYWKVATFNNGELSPSLVTEVRGFATVYEYEHCTDSVWTNDADSGISVGKLYTHKVNYHTSESASTYVNGVIFENDDDRTGMNWSLAGAGNAADGTHHVTGDGGALVNNMYYNYDAVLTITGLTPGTDYVFTQYTRGWGPAYGRLVNIETNIDADLNLLDGNMDGDGNGHLFMYSYTAPASGELVVTYLPINPDSWHHYAFSNEVAVPAYVDPTPLPNANVDADVALSWVLKGDVVNPTYNVKVATDAAMTNVVKSTTTAATTYAPGLDPEVTYYWQVQIVENSAVIYTSPAWKFITIPPTPATKVIEWKFDETTGTQALQTAGTPDAVGTLVGFNDPTAGHIAGLVGNGLRLNGADEYVDVSNASVYMPTALGQDFAVSGYICTYGYYGPLFSMRNDLLDAPLIDITLGDNGVTDAAGQITFLVRGDTGPHSSVASGITVNDGRWHNFVVTRVGSIWKLYVDGTVRASINGAATGDVTLDMLSIGASLKWIDTAWPGAKHSFFFDGMIDEYTVWDGELLSSQIAELASVLPTQGDVTLDAKTDITDMTEFAGNWLTSTITDVQPTMVLEDMESYTMYDPNFPIDPNIIVNHNWVYTPETNYAALDLTVISDVEYGQVLQLKYDYTAIEPATNLHGHMPVELVTRGADASIFDQIDIRIMKKTGCELESLILDFRDGRTIVEPVQADLFDRGRIIIDISEVPVDEWVVVSGIIPNNIDMNLCHDLYQILFSIQNPVESARTGTLYIDSIELTDGTIDCVPQPNAMMSDINGDCSVDMLDFTNLAEGWLDGVN